MLLTTYTGEYSYRIKYNLASEKRIGAPTYRGNKKLRYGKTSTTLAELTETPKT